MCKREEVTGDWRKLHSEELCDLYCSPNIIWVIKLRRTRWAGNVACMGVKRNAYKVLAGKLKERDHLEELHIDGKVILTWIVGGMGGCGLHPSGSG